MTKPSPPPARPLVLLVDGEPVEVEAFEVGERTDAWDGAARARWTGLGSAAATHPFPPVPGR